MGFFSRYTDKAPEAGALRNDGSEPSASGGGPQAHVVHDGIPLGVRALILAPLVGLLAAAASIGCLFIYYTILYPDPLSLRPKKTGPLVRIIGYDGSIVAERGVSRAYIPLDMLPPHVSQAVVATEDRRFFKHPGLDIISMVRASLANLRAGRIAEGGSTLTQQLAKNMFLTSERTLTRKAEEVVLALWLELRLSKSDILELYLNRVYFGAGAHGIEAAAQRYFAKSARDLSVAEAAIIAGLLKAPSKYAPSTSPTQALARGRVVLSKMRKAGFITEAQEVAAANEKVRFSTLMRMPSQADVAYAVDFALDRAASFEAAEEDEIIIETSLDARLQRRANAIVQAELARWGQDLNAHQAAVVVLAPDGGIRALVGGRSYAESQFNRAAQARRQPGSAFKPIVYLTALEAGLKPDSPVRDERITIQGWSPKNDNGRYLGTTTLRVALAHSINSVAVRLLLDAGARRVVATARRLGIKSALRSDASLALGTSEVSLLELTGAYAAFANGGYVHEPWVIRRVRTGSGRVLYTRLEAKSSPTISAANVAAMNDMLGETLASGTGKRAALSDHPAAGKTGTTQDFRDAWFVGYTAHLTAGVWIGNDNGEAMHNVRGGGLPADIWRQVMVFAHQGLPPRILPDGAATGRPLASSRTPPAARRAEESDSDKLMALVKAAETEAATAEAAPQSHGATIEREPSRATSLSGAVGTAITDDWGRIIVRPPRR